MRRNRELDRIRVPTPQRQDQRDAAVPRREGLEVLLGAPLDLPLKIGIVRGLLPTFAPVPQGGPTYLDVTVPERPVAGRNPQVSG